jgi:DNA-binding XRE family transcriptional regulator
MSRLCAAHFEQSTGKMPLITVAQIRAARALLAWSQEDLAREAGVVRRTLTGLETQTAETKVETMEKVVAALEAHGIEFVRQGEAFGVILRPRRKRARAHSSRD